MTSQEMGRKGGKACLKTMTAAQRRRRALKAVKARWAVEKAAQKVQVEKR